MEATRSGNAVSPVACVVGGGALGNALVRHLAQRGWRGAVLARHETAHLPDTWGWQQVDATHPAQVHRALEAERLRHGGLTGVVCTAGAWMFSPLGKEENSAQVLEELWRANVGTAWATAQACARVLDEGGSLVLVGAYVVGAMPPPGGQAAYRAAKAAVHSLVTSLAEELGPRGIRVNGIAPTILDTEANRRAMPDGRWQEWVPLEEAAQAVAFLLSDASRAVTGSLLTLRRWGGSQRVVP